MVHVCTTHMHRAQTCVESMPKGTMGLPTFTSIVHKDPVHYSFEITIMLVQFVVSILETKTSMLLGTLVHALHEPASLVPRPHPAFRRLLYGIFSHVSMT